MGKIARCLRAEPGSSPGASFLRRGARPARAAAAAAVRECAPPAAASFGGPSGIQAQIVRSSKYIVISIFISFNSGTYIS